MTDVIKIKFEPQADITAFELATILSRIKGHGLRHAGLSSPLDIRCEVWAELDSGVKRHFVEQN